MLCHNDIIQIKCQTNIANEKKEDCNIIRTQSITMKISKIDWVIRLEKCFVSFSLDIALRFHRNNYGNVQHLNRSELPRVYTVIEQSGVYWPKVAILGTRTFHENLIIFKKSNSQLISSIGCYLDVCDSLLLNVTNISFQIKG